jgi:hypothetical protein
MGQKGSRTSGGRFGRPRFGVMRGRNDLRKQTSCYAKRAWLEMAVIELLETVAPPQNTTASLSEYLIMKRE